MRTAMMISPHADDAARAIGQILEDDCYTGPTNLVAPKPVTNHDFTKTLGRVLRRPTLLPIPSLLARIAFGKVADELLMASTRVRPDRLLEFGFESQFPDLEAALRNLLR